MTATSTGPVVLHVGPYDATELARRLDAGEVATGFCGAERIPTAPPFPAGAVVCTACVVELLQRRRSAADPGCER